MCILQSRDYNLHFSITFIWLFEKKVYFIIYKHKNNKKWRLFSRTDATTKPFNLYYDNIDFLILQLHLNFTYLLYFEEICTTFINNL